MNANVNTPADTLAAVQKILSEELDVAIDQLGPDRMLEELGVDSLGMIEVMFRLEEEFDIRVGDELVPIKSVRDVADLVDTRIRARDAQGA